MMSKAERENLANLEAKLHAVELELSNLKVTSSAEIEKAKKDAESSRSSCTYQSERAMKVEQELEAAHSLLDGLPQSPPREAEAKESYNRRPYPLTTRLASWIAKVAFSEAFAKIGIK